MVHLAVTNKPSEMVISWMTSLPTESQAIVWADSQPNNQSTFVGTQSTYLESAGWFHNVIATGLYKNTMYQYQCGNAETGWSSTFTFKTAPEDGTRDNRTFIIYGDMGIVQYSYYTVEHVSQLVEAGNIDLIYQSGDFGYGNDRDAMFYELSWNLFFYQLTVPMATVPYMTAPGNHEVSCGHSECDFYASNFTVYNTRFRMPGQDHPTASNMWFSFNYGNVHWVSISTETDYPNCPNPTDTFGDQLGWLEADLIAANADPNIDWILVTGHQPVYCSVSSKSTILGIPKGDSRHVQQAFEDLFYKYKVDVYFDGHVHGYERTYPVYKSTVRGNYTLDNYENPQAPVYIVNGSAGNIEGFYDDWHDIIPSWSAKRYWPNPEHGFGVINTAGANTFEWTWYRNGGKPLDNDYFDHFTITRTAN
eukprot:CAMPEP_0117015144 /NCGR_PEP_ID=MMETSP0472-20121206/12154_1 /TAXON_ID=693140 ORGANISM="Tiarina fusus, Strain LIS" /NCGR_SAMPLE_ID=MMETSP0472 /ASSEMBLY_ACC=CAM_ASM_000603 /LENGTH=419 /DNA_ID=CAMNT_0004718879 /DNA_START=100 /DNA_END=1359 /DNA_ORIENTATION=+